MDLAGAPESKKPRWSPNLSSNGNGTNNGAANGAASRPVDLFANYGYGNQAAINQPFGGAGSLAQHQHQQQQAQQQQQQQQHHLNQGMYGAPTLTVNTANANGMTHQMSPSTPGATSPFPSHAAMPMQQSQSQQGQQVNGGGFGNGFGGYAMMNMGMASANGMGGMGMGGMNGMNGMGMLGFPYSPQMGSFPQVRGRYTSS